MRLRHNFKNMKIWKLGMEIVEETFLLTNHFPSSEKFGLISQINNCSVSIPSNIAEGSSRTNKSFSHFLDISLGSSFELYTQLLIALKRKYIKETEFKLLEDKIEEFQKMTSSFQSSLE